MWHSIPVLVCIVSFYYCAIIYYMAVLFIHSPIEGHLGGFHLWAIVYEVAINIYIEISVGT